MSNDPIALDLWTEFIEELRQSGCPNLEAEGFQPLVCTNLEETLEALKRLWAYAAFFEEGLSPVFSSLVSEISKNPFAKLHPLGRALTFLLLKKIGAPTFPLVPMNPLMPFFKSCQLALLWAIAGQMEEAFALGCKLFPLTFLPTLWCKEEEFSEREASLSISLLRRAFNQKGDIPQGPVDPYFLALAKLSPRWEYSMQLPHRVVDPGLGFSYLRGDRFAFAMTLAGEGSPLGSFYVHPVEVRAFGPQISPFNEPNRFGILRLPDSQPMERWTSLAALPEVWMEAKSQFERDERAARRNPGPSGPGRASYLSGCGKGLAAPYRSGESPSLEEGVLQCHLTVRFFGQTVEKPLYFSFYLKASDCEVEQEAFRPRTLKRYQGEAKPALFGKKLKIESLLPGKMEIIPLAGEGGFWGCDFLLAFEIPPFEARGEYRLSIVY